MTEQELLRRINAVDWTRQQSALVAERNGVKLVAYADGHQTVDGKWFNEARLAVRVWNRETT